MPSSSDTSTHSSDMVDDKNAASKATKDSLFRRATSKLRSFYCLSDEPNPSSTSSEDATKKNGTDKGNKDETPDDQNMKTEFKHLDRKLDDEDQPYFIERKKEDIDKGEKKDWWQLYAFCVVRRYDSDGYIDETCLYVNPQPLRQLLKDVVVYYPADPIDVDDVQISAPYHSLFYYRKELEDVGVKRFQENDDAQSLEQLKLLLGWIRTTFELEIAAHEKCMSSDLKAIAYDRLWTIFKPGTIVHTQLHKVNRAFHVTDHWYDKDDDDDPGFNLECRFVDYDGDRLGTRTLSLHIPKYSGVRDIREQAVKPLALLEDADEIKEELLARGMKFEQYAMGQRFMQYTGLGMKKHPQYPNKYLRFDASGRVMIDVKTYHRLDANDAIWVNAFDKNHNDEGKLTDEDRILTNSMVRGYSLNAKKFLELFVDNLSEIKWNTRCFEDLVLDPATKKTVQALVSTHSRKPEPSDDEDTFDDIVKGKGKGLVCVLHGPPGVGKTLTAECVAEYVQRPLFMVSSGDLGVTSEQLDVQLTEIMDMTSTWRAVLLIDEADVFLEQRALHDLHRNAMVSVFLRVLEYYAGILFLTTNRVATFDDAFKSRIHIPIRYTDLDVKSRLQIWRSFCKRVPGGVDISDDEYNLLAEIDLNGRQIKNVIKAAESLAAFDKVALDFKQLQQVTKIQARFEKDLESFGDIDYTAPGSAKKHAASGHMYY
ncbi:putative AAA domain-containing protein C24B10.10c [Cytospora mali]|uniref:AAA domain-containing protein C24B10.10c n=1 Tax=Cytospora mali TaxID=578113 RepID=A0A194W9L7_CYTMA|nr:putative AAA domain-containing protein C24B10.10c [Valsa mali]